MNTGRRLNNSIALMVGLLLGFLLMTALWPAKAKGYEAHRAVTLTINAPLNGLDVSALNRVPVTVSADDSSTVSSVYLQLASGTGAIICHCGLTGTGPWTGELPVFQLMAGIYRVTAVGNITGGGTVLSPDVTIVVSRPAEQGPAGPPGPTGSAGGQGPTGPVGPAGPQGLQGIAGPNGAQGLTGSTGLAGPQGSRGDQGLTGAQGLQGNPGAAGAQGPRGDQGPLGPVGLQGIAGPAGAAGPAGPQGPVGPPGATVGFPRLQRTTMTFTTATLFEILRGQPGVAYEVNTTVLVSQTAKVLLLAGNGTDCADNRRELILETEVRAPGFTILAEPIPEGMSVCMAVREGAGVALNVTFREYR